MNTLERRRRNLKALVFFLLCLGLCSCGGETGTLGERAGSDRVIVHDVLTVDTVRTRKDPKGGWFGPSLWDIYPEGEDTPEVFCGSGPRVPTGEEITLFFIQKPSTAESSSCNQIIGVASGPAEWDDQTGKPITDEELKTRAEGEDHLISMWFDGFHDLMDTAWHKIRPVGPPCTDTSGSPQSVADRYRGQKCSIAVEYTDVPPRGETLILFVNWIVTGLVNDRSNPVAPEDAVANIQSNHGGQYLVVRDYQSSLQPQPQAAAQPSVPGFASSPPAGSTPTQLPCDSPIESSNAVVLTGSSGKSTVRINETTWFILGDTPEFDPAPRHARIERHGDYCGIEIDGLPNDSVVKDRWQARAELEQ